MPRVFYFRSTSQGTTILVKPAMVRCPHVLTQRCVRGDQAVRFLPKALRLVAALVTAVALLLITSRSNFSRPALVAIDHQAELADLRAERAELLASIQQDRLEGARARETELERRAESRRMLVSRSASYREEARYRITTERIEDLVPEEYMAWVVQAGDRFGVDPRLIASVVTIESQWREHLTGTHGDAGLMQILPETGRGIAREMGLDDYDLYDPKTNLMMGTYYLRSLYKEYKTWPKALAAYNGGPRVANQGVNWPYTQWVLRIYEEGG